MLRVAPKEWALKVLAASDWQSAINRIGRQNYHKKGLRPRGHRSVELHFDFCLQQK
jgi:hypothetical protein